MKNDEKKPKTSWNLSAPQREERNDGVSPAMPAAIEHPVRHDSSHTTQATPDALPGVTYRHSEQGLPTGLCFLWFDSDNEDCSWHHRFYPCSRRVVFALIVVIIVLNVPGRWPETLLEITK